MKHMKKVLISVLVALLTSMAMTAQVTRKEIKVGNFSRLVVTDNVNVNYRCNADSAGIAVINGTQEEIKNLIFSLNDKGRLSIQVEDEFERKHHVPNITIYSSSLDEAENAGDSTLRITGLPPMKEFKVRNIDNGKVIAKGLRVSKLELQILSGKGKIIADGTCDDLAAKLIGTGEIQADNVKATAVTCRIMGTGNIGCNVNGGELKVSGSGTGKIYYKGKPSKVSVRKLGTIKAIPID
jgi:hypothetical protein